MLALLATIYLISLLKTPSANAVKVLVSADGGSVIQY